VAAGKQAGHAVFDLGPLAYNHGPDLVHECVQLVGERSAHRFDHN